MKSNPILSQWYNRDVFEKIERLFREENGMGAMDFFYKDTMELICMWQAEGKVRKDIDNELIMAMFMAIINIDTHKEAARISNAVVSETTKKTSAEICICFDKRRRNG